MFRRVRSGLPVTEGGRRAVLGAVFAVLAVLLLSPTTRGLTVEQDTIGVGGEIPARVYVPDDLDHAGAPGVVVVHGLAGSSALMHTWSLALAHAGFVVLAPDLPGHGRSLMSLGDRGAALDGVVSDALSALRALPFVDEQRVALLGHSMGSGAVLAVGMAEPDAVRAVVAVSPLPRPVTSDAPRDLLLLAGANERRFVATATTLLEQAGGERGSPGEGDARSLVIVPMVEHVSILFSPTAAATSVAWLSAALEHDPSGPMPVGPLVGWLFLALAILTWWRGLVAQAATPADPPAARVAPWAALFLGGVAATASLVIIERSVDLADVTGILLAGEVGLWFLMTGAVWLRFGVRPSRPEARDLGWGVLATMMLVALGASTTFAWASWWLSGPRIANAVLLSALVLPYSIAAATVLQGSDGRTAVRMWLLTSFAVTSTLAVATVVIPSTGFLLLVLPLLPLVLAVTTATSVGVGRPWATGVANAVFLGWLLAMLFPLA